MLLTAYGTASARMLKGILLHPKRLLAGKFLVFLLLTAVMQASATGYGQNVSLSLNDVPLEKALIAIKAESGYHLAYMKEWMQTAKKVTLRVKDVPLTEALDACFKGQPLTYAIVENTIVVKLRPAPEEQAVPAVKIQGVVTGENGEPLAGVSVMVKGSGARGTMTDSTGAFVVEANPGDVLIVSSVGYDAQKIKVGNSAHLSIALVRADKSLNEVVIVGYGTQQKVNLTGAVATVGADKLEDRPIVNLADGLEGLIPNLNVNLGSGQPGRASSFNIRNYTTIGSGSNSAPLVLVDGVERDPDLIDPNMVANVTVLKDAASAAIYGGRAAFGVILITTKNPRRGTKPEVTYTGSYTTDRPAVLPKYLSSVEYLQLFDAAQQTGLATGGTTSTNPFTAKDSAMIRAYYKDPSHNPDAYPDPGNPSEYRYVGNTDWIKVMYPGWAPMQEHYVSLSSGEGRTTYVGGLGYFRQEGLEKVADQIYQRYTPSLKINSDITSWLTANLTMSMTHTNNNQPTGSWIGQGGPTNGAWIPGDLRPVMPVYNPDGNFSGQGSYSNPVAIMKQSGRDISNINDFWTTGRVILKPVNHFTVTSDFTWNGYFQTETSNIIPFNEYGVNGTFLDIFPWTNPSAVTIYTAQNTYTAFNAYATYENTFASKHYVKAMVGYNQEYQHYNNYTTTAKDLEVPNLPAIGLNNDPKPTITNTETQYGLVGTFFRVNYIYDKRYLLEVNGRYDGTSRFPQYERYVFSPSVSAGWAIAEEGFMRNLKPAVDQLKLRVSYGQLPNQLAGTIPSSGAQYPYIATMSSGQVGYLMNGILANAVYAPGLISPTLTWEKVQTTNFGLDYGLFNNRLSGSFDYYITYTKDMLVASHQLPAVLGTPAPSTNSADLRTSGWELSATWSDHLVHNKLSYSVAVGLADAQSTITRYGNNPTGYLNDYIPGQKVGNVWGYVTQGFYQSNAAAAAVNNSALGGYTWVAGDIQYKDLNKDGAINAGQNTLANHGDLALIGNTTPRYKLSINLNMAYAGFDFRAFVFSVLKDNYDPTSNYVFGIFSGNEWNLPYGGTMNYWTPTHTNAYFGTPGFNRNGNLQTQTHFLQNSAFTRLKQLTLGYTLPRATVNKWKLEKVRVYVSGNNLLTLTKIYQGFDPELVDLHQGDFRTYPLNRSYSFGVQVSL